MKLSEIEAGIRARYVDQPPEYLEAALMSASEYDQRSLVGDDSPAMRIAKEQFGRIAGLGLSVPTWFRELQNEEVK